MAKQKAKVKTNTNIESNPKKTESQSIAATHNGPLLFGKKNYLLMLLGLAVIFIGYLLMMGTNNNVESLDAVFPSDDVYSFRRIVLAPAVIIFGFLIELYSILKIKKSA